MYSRSTSISLGLFGLVALTGLGGVAQAQSKVVLNSGTVLPVRLEDELTSNNSRKGDRFVATIDDKDSNEKWSSDSLPAGSTIKGYVRAVTPKKDKKPGMLDLAFDRVVLPDGRAFSIQGSLISLDNKSITKTEDGRLIANKGHSTDRLTYVGYGAGAGALIGLITSRKHTLEDALLGAGAGYLFGSLEKGKSPSDVKLKSGTHMGVRLDSRVSYSRN